MIAISTWLPADALETTVLIVVGSMNIHQYDHCHFLDPHVPSFPKTSRTYSYQITEVVLPTPTVRTGIIGPDFRTLELPLLVWSDYFFFFFCLKLSLRRSLFAVRSPPYPREGISNVLA